MNTLTKNRILQKGDEYRKNGSWMPVPEVDYGMQIMFTKYTEVRRPSEAGLAQSKPCIITQRNDLKGLPAKGTATSVIPIAEATARVVMPEAKPIKTPSTSQVKLSDIPPSRITPCWHEKRINLSRHADQCAHCGAMLPTLFVPPPPTTAPPSMLPAGMKGAAINVSFGASPKCEWIGRNGKYRQTSINLIRLGELFRIVPQGVRGMAKNAQIEFPASIIPQITDWLLQQQLESKLLTPKT